MKNIRFLTVEEVILFHTMLVDTFGGSHGIRDYGLLDSAIAQPRASFETINPHCESFHQYSLKSYRLTA